jgi:DNA-binding IclR family transcriptional regulator
MVKLNSASVDEVAREIRKRKGVTFKLLEELRERGYVTVKRAQGKVRFSLRT